MSFSRRRLVAGSFLALGLAGCDRLSPNQAPTFFSTDITGAEFARKLELPDVDGTPRSLADWKGKVTVVFFGYTQCPDVCPTTMIELAQVKQQLGAAGADVQGVFVTVDPERDTPELLRAYVKHFDPSFVALRGSPEETKAAAKAFKVFYSRAPGKTADTYTVDHTAGSYLFDRQGRVRVFTRYGSGGEALVADLKTLLAESAA